ncbi:MAG: hypothetical protein U0704_03095 [Candidatus Eisenbacteria bacterium]
MNFRPLRRLLPAVLAVLFAAAFAMTPAPVVRPAAAQVVKPWAPASDTLLQLASAARVRFQRATGDSATGLNFDAYDLVAQASRRLLRVLGRDNVRQAPAIESTLDSLGLDTDVVYDPASPTFVFVLVRNPSRASADAIGFLFWYRGNQLMQQGIGFPPSLNPRLKVWWTGRAQGPYEAAILFDRKLGTRVPALKLLRMGDNAAFWNLIQYEGKGPHFEPGAESVFADLNQDGLPELLVYNRFQPDSTLKCAPGAPGLVNELLYTERPEGFVLHDMRTLPGPVYTLFLFTELLEKKQYDRARQMMLKPEKLADALARGWGSDRGKGAWLVEYGESGQPWPEWLALKVREKGGSKRWIFHFTIRDDRWVIRDWIPVTDPRPGRPGAAPADSARGGAARRP